MVFGLRRGFAYGVQILTPYQPIPATTKFWRQKALDINHVVSGTFRQHRRSQPVKVFRTLQHLRRRLIDRQKMDEINKNIAAIRDGDTADMNFFYTLIDG